ncbi:MAG TPA: RagB/SusD family nutrient uptake outer membrane protein, partial [Puia sp.]
EFLAKSPDSSQASLSTVAGYQNLLDNEWLTVSVSPGIEFLCTDDYVFDRNRVKPEIWGLYTWNPILYQATDVTENSWEKPYRAINFANDALAHLPKLPASELAKTDDYSWAYGTALFLRAFHYFFLEETFGQPYDPNTATSAKGVVLRLGIDPEDRPDRSSVAEVYDLIMHDLTAAVRYLPRVVQHEHINRPTLPAAYAMLARACLVRQDFHAAQVYADSCLTLTDSLLRYDEVSTANSKLFDGFNNPELLFQCSGLDLAPVFPNFATVDSTLYDSYDSNDLRRSLFFQPSAKGPGVIFWGFYSTGRLLFSGLAVDEAFLVRAECKARNKDIQGAMGDLNKLLATRWRPGTYHDYQAATPEMALDIVLRERRKELVGRELRFSDLRRLMNEPFALTIRRATGEHLQPGDSGWTLPIPALEISRGGVTQN